jgi:hypothetical protein
MDEIIQAILEGKEPNQALDNALALPQSEQEELIRRLGALKSPLTGAFLSALYPRLSDRVIQKLVKKAIFHLKTLGIAVEGPKAAGESALKPIDTSREAMGLLSNYDGESLRVILAAVELKKNQFLFSHAISHFSNGLVDLQSMAVSRPQLEELTRDYVARTKSPILLTEISPLYAGYLIEEAASISGHDTEDARSLNRMLSSAKGNARKPADIYLFETEADLVPASSEAVLGDELFKPLTLDWRGIEEDRKRLNDAISPGIVLPSSAIRERKTDFFVELVKKEQIQPVLPAFKRMLEDSAYLFYCLKELPLYAGIMSLLKAPDGVEAALTYFLDKALTEREKKEEQHQQPGLIVDPYSLGRR